MIASLLLVAALAQADDTPRVRGDLDALFTYSIGSQSALGGELLGLAGFPVWSSGKAVGTVDTGLWLGFQAEPWSMAPWVDPETTKGMSSRVRFLPNLGHTVHVGGARGGSIGLHVYGGAVLWNSTGRVTYEDVGVSGEASITRVVGDWGAFLRGTWRPHPVVGMSLVLGGPFYGATSSSYVVDLFTVGGGLTFQLGRARGGSGAL